MSSVVYKKRINKELEQMDAEKLKQTWRILKEIGAAQKHFPVADKKNIETLIAKGIKQLDKGEGTDFSQFIGAMKKKYGRR